jgi:hypothetical protein
MKTKLKNCVFCDSNDVYSIHSCGEYWLGCKRCHAVGPSMSSIRKAINAWNKRPTEDLLEDTVIRMEGHIEAKTGGRFPG